MKKRSKPYHYMDALQAMINLQDKYSFELRIDTDGDIIVYPYLHNINDYFYIYMDGFELHDPDMLDCTTLKNDLQDILAHHAYLENKWDADAQRDAQRYLDDMRADYEALIR